MLKRLVDGIEPVKGRTGRPRKRPEKLHADKGYDFPQCRQALCKRSIKARIARRGVESSERLGRHRWVVERTLAWLARYRYGAEDHHEARKVGKRSVPTNPAKASDGTGSVTLGSGRGWR